MDNAFKIREVRDMRTASDPVVDVKASVRFGVGEGIESAFRLVESILIDKFLCDSVVGRNGNVGRDRVAKTGLFRLMEVVRFHPSQLYRLEPFADNRRGLEFLKVNALCTCMLPLQSRAWDK